MSLYPEAASVVNEKLFMDNYLDLIENVIHAIKFSRDLFLLLELGGFISTKFVIIPNEKTLAMNPESSPIKKKCNGAKQSSHVLGFKLDHVKDNKSTNLLLRIWRCWVSSSIHY